LVLTRSGNMYSLNINEQCSGFSLACKVNYISRNKNKQQQQNTMQYINKNKNNTIHVVVTIATLVAITAN